MARSARSYEAKRSKGRAHQGLPLPIPPCPDPPAATAVDAALHPTHCRPRPTVADPAPG
jgi:hypothetical protein